MSSLALPQIHCLESPALQRLVAVELLAQSAVLGLSEDVQQLLQRGIQETDNAGTRVLNRLRVQVDVRPVIAMALYAEDRSWEESALRYFVMRQAHYPLIRELFGVARSQVSRLRRELGAPQPPLRAQRIPPPLLIPIWQDWQQVQRDFERQADQWIAIAQRYPSFPLSALYHELVVEADTRGLNADSPKEGGAA